MNDRLNEQLKIERNAFVGKKECFISAVHEECENHFVTCGTKSNNNTNNNNIQQRKTKTQIAQINHVEEGKLHAMLRSYPNIRCHTKKFASSIDST